VPLNVFSRQQGFSVPDQELSSHKAQRERLVGLAQSGDKGDAQAPSWLAEKDLSV
jgi:hypothetical protein